ncbi:MAG: hypothetical protein IPN76_25460 [Saprospiraceae bacterium]|nr:hypothetical protein [Saprospiraceae bacterium]
MRRYSEAEIVLREAIKKTYAKYKGPFSHLFGVISDIGKFEEYVQMFDEYCTETHVSWHGGVGDIIFYYLKDPKRAEPYYQKGFEKSYEDIQNKSTNTYGLAHFYRLNGVLDKAEAIMKSYKCTDLWYLLEHADLLLQMAKAAGSQIF